ncbi:hypothetical protein COOONC_03441 [Cooperia oncophora]
MIHYIENTQPMLKIISTICTQVPPVFRDGGTFALDIEACGGERMLCQDGHEWMKPSGSSRYFRFDGDDNITRVDRAGVAPTAERFDIQVGGLAFVKFQVS